MTYSEAIRFLYSLRLFGAKLGLENTFKLAGLAGNPQEKLRFIHVAGTNGKGSTCAILESIYRAAGLRTGLFTSPHLVSFRERMQVCRRWISQMEVVRLVEELQTLLAQFPKEHHPTFFEVVTVMGLRFFADQKCDLVVWETGLGGRMDATNIVRPAACIITNISLDHQQWLGATVERIAFEKAGIIKPGIPILTGADDPDVLAVIENTARGKKAPLTIVAEGADAPAPLPGEHQRRNAALALATVEVLRGQIPVSMVQIRAGLQNVDWPGRLQTVQTPAGRKFLLDGAHNVAGALVLRTALGKVRSDETTLILGILQDKDWEQICETLAPIAGKIITVPVSSERAANASLLAESCRAANPAAEIAACDSLSAALKTSESRGRPGVEHLTVITGSLYLVGEALELLGYFPSAQSERELNEWSADCGGSATCQGATSAS